MRGVLSVLALSLVVAPSAGVAQTLKNPNVGSGLSEQRSTLVVGEVVSELAKNAMIVFQGKNDDYWFGSDGQGVYRYDGKILTRLTTKHGLSHNRIRGIQEDRSGHVFFTTLGGIDKFDGRTIVKLPPTRSRAPDQGWKLQPDDLWFASNQDDNGPYRFDGETLYDLEFPKHDLEDGFYAKVPNAPYNPYQVYTVYKDRGGHIWLGTSTFGACRFDGKSLSWLYEKHLTQIGENGSFGIRSIIEDKAGKFWFCNTRHRFTIFPDQAAEKKKGLIDYVSYHREPGIDDLKTADGEDLIYYMSIVEDKKHNLWMATYGLGVWRYDGAKLTHYPIKDGGKNVRLFSISKDNRGDLWLGTHEAGAYKFNGETFEKFRPRAHE